MDAQQILNYIKRFLIQMQFVQQDQQMVQIQAKIVLLIKIQNNRIKILKTIKMSIRNSRANSRQKQVPSSSKYSYVPIEPATHEFYSIPNNRYYTNPSTNTYQHSRLTQNEVSRITGNSKISGQVIKGQSRIQYVPYQRKVVQYQTRTITEKIPRTRKVVEYQERRVYQDVPREVVKQQYMAVEKITQYYKQYIPEKRIQMVPVQKKVKKYEYVPIQKQIIHYPQDLNFQNARNQSRVVLESQGVAIRSDAEYKPIQSDLLYKFTNNVDNHNVPVGYVDLGSRRYLSTAPTYVNNQPQTSNNLGQSNVKLYNGQYSSFNDPAPQIEQNFEAKNSFINQITEPQTYNNVFSGNQYDHRYNNVQGNYKINEAQKYSNLSSANKYHYRQNNVQGNYKINDPQAYSNVFPGNKYNYKYNNVEENYPKY